MATGAFAGLVDGLTRGYGISRDMARREEESAARAEERAYQREQRDRLRREQAADDEIDRRIAAVPTTSEKWGAGYDQAVARGAPMRDDEGNVMPGVQSTPRASREVFADQAAAVRGIGGRRGAAVANQLQGFANAEVDREEAAADRSAGRALRDIQLRQAKALESWRQAGVRYSRGDLVGTLQTLSSGYEAVPDGRQLVVTNGMFGLATPDGKWVEPPVPINRENVEAALAHAQRFLDPSAWAQFQGVRQTDQRIKDESDYRSKTLALDEGRLGLGRDTLNAQIKGGYFTRADRPPSGNATEQDRVRQYAESLFKSGRAKNMDEAMVMAWGAAFRDPNARDGKSDEQEWRAVEKKLIEQGYKPAEIDQQRTAFFVRAGYAPPGAEAALRSGINPATKKPLSASDVDEFNRRFPRSAVDPKELRWLIR